MNDKLGSENVVLRCQRYEWIDIAKGMAIICVVIGHATVGNHIYDMIYAFHMPFFFIMAGYLLNISKWGNQLNLFIKNRARRLLKPYLLGAMSFAVLYCIVL